MPTTEYIEIPLTQGQVTRVSAHRYAALSRMKWFAWRNPHTDTFYAMTYITWEGRRVQISMHRLILGLNPGDPRQGDHVKTRETLNNTDENLRIANRSQQQQNRLTQRNNKSGYKGVFEFYPGLFAAAIWVKKKKIHLGYRKSAKAAYEELYVPAAIKHYGEFANFQH